MPRFIVTLALVCTPLVDAAGLSGVAEVVCRDGIWVAAVLFPAGFFLSSAAAGATRPNRLIGLAYLGAASLLAGVVALGVGLLTR